MPSSQLQKNSRTITDIGRATVTFFAIFSFIIFVENSCRRTGTTHSLNYSKNYLPMGGPHFNKSSYAEAIFTKMLLKMLLLLTSYLYNFFDLRYRHAGIVFVYL